MSPNTFSPTGFSTIPRRQSTAPVNTPLDRDSVCEKDAVIQASETERNSELPSSVLKAVREFEHDRHRTRKAEELVRAKERKERGTYNRRPGATKRSQGGAGGGVRALKGVWDVQAERDGRSEDAGGEVLDASAGVGSWWSGSLRRSDRTEVKLADLVTVAKKTKNRDFDFELIPHAQSVIVLDDSFPEDMGPDEPWVHIFGVDDEDAKASAPSYAQVAKNH